jgi:phosphoglycerate dehydrogenase-like enzyme
MESEAMVHRCAILDDYQKVALKLADWSKISDDVEIQVFNNPLGDQQSVIRTLAGFSIVCLMRERTPFPRAAFEALPNLRLVLTTGMRNAAIDLAAAQERHVAVCGTESTGHPTAELTFGLMLELARKIGYENARLRAGAPWQNTLGVELAGKTLGVIGIGKLGSKVVQIGRAFAMRPIAWSQNLSDEKARAAGATLVTKEELFRQSDFVSVHVQLSPRTRALIGAAELGVMKPTVFFINTSRGPIVEETALIDALREKRIAGAGLDVYDVEPLPLDHPLRRLDNAVITPHLGYVTEDNYRRGYAQIVENIRTWLDGKPMRVLAPG